MIPDGRYAAVVDRLEDGLATLELEDDEGELYELTVEPGELPDPARHADAILEVAVEDQELVDVGYDDEATKQQQDAAQSRFDRLSRRPPSDSEE